MQLITSKGYPAERHFVTTSDGYILQMHRIPYSPKHASKPLSLQLTVEPIWTLMGKKKVSILVKCPFFRGLIFYARYLLFGEEYMRGVLISEVSLETPHP